ncbi:MAG: adenylate/guanylate cyclase domain-containing protein [Gammaproteobacteria bacterium]|nr:adenylate/guanylate cyclase domain-containing protein [Gammaproteobacteria bacterium]
MRLMRVRRRTLRSLAICAVSGASGASIGFGYTLLIDGTAAVGASIGLVIGLSIAAFEVFAVAGTGPAGSYLRRLSLPVFVGVTTLIWAVIIVASLYAIPWIHDSSVPPYPYSESTFRQDFTFSFLISLLLNAAIRVRALVGSRVLFNFLLGRYHRPVREERIFLFLDLKDSSALAEQLGDIRVQSLISRFFFDISGPVVDFGGETHRYIGDEVVATWPLGSPADNARAVLCLLEIQALITRRADWYQRQLGAVPRFRAGLHGGPVVASEVGDDKREIVYFGDTINTAARLQDLCRSYQRSFLVSGELLNRMRLPEHVATERLGEATLRGKTHTVEVYAVSTQSGQEYRAT